MSDEHKDRILTCVYCGHAYPPGSPAHGAKVLTEHIKVCPKHPLTKANEFIVELYEALEGSMPDDCSCSADQLQDACACGYDLASLALNHSKAYYLELIRRPA